MQLINLDNALYNQERIFSFKCNLLLIHLIYIIFRDDKSIILKLHYFFKLNNTIITIIKLLVSELII